MGDPAGCQWPGLEHPLYARYHDEEWGVPPSRDVALYEKLVLEGFQAGLSWLTILKKREDFRRAFDGFDPQRVASYGARDVARLMGDASIVRNRLKIVAAIDNARAYLKLREDTTLATFLWSHLETGPVLNSWHKHADIPAQTGLSKAISKALKEKGFGFVGPTTAYAFMQSVGMVNDHLSSCARHGMCERLQRAFKASSIK